jgi:hypothetical protein
MLLSGDESNEESFCCVIVAANGERQDPILFIQAHPIDGSHFCYAPRLDSPSCSIRRCSAYFDFSDSLCG